MGHVDLLTVNSAEDSLKNLTCWGSKNVIVEHFLFLQQQSLCACPYMCICAAVCHVVYIATVYLIRGPSGNCNEGTAWSLCTSVCESMIACEGQRITDMSC